MKKIVVILAFLISLPAFGMCPVNGDNTVCALPDFRKEVEPIYNPGYGISEFSNTPEARLKPLDRKDIIQQSKEFSPSGSEFNYNSSCQFGVCLQNRSTPIFEQPKQ